MRNAALTLVLVFSLAFNIAFVGIWVYHRPRPRPPLAGRSYESRQGGMRRPSPPWAQFALTPDQEQKVSKGWREVEGRMRELRQDAADHRDRLFALMEEEPPDEAAVLEAQKSIEATQEQIRKLVVGQMLKTRELLDEEQRHQWLSKMRSHGDRLGMRRWRNGPGPRRGRVRGGPPQRMRGRRPIPPARVPQGDRRESGD